MLPFIIIKENKNLWKIYFTDLEIFYSSKLGYLKERCKNLEIPINDYYFTFNEVVLDDDDKYLYKYNIDVLSEVILKKKTPQQIYDQTNLEKNLNDNETASEVNTKSINSESTESHNYHNTQYESKNLNNNDDTNEDRTNEMNHGHTNIIYNYSNSNNNDDNNEKRSKEMIKIQINDISNYASSNNNYDNNEERNEASSSNDHSSGYYPKEKKIDNNLSIDSHKKMINSHIKKSNKKKMSRKEISRLIKENSDEFLKKCFDDIIFDLVPLHNAFIENVDKYQPGEENTYDLKISYRKASEFLTQEQILIDRVESENIEVKSKRKFLIKFIKKLTDSIDKKKENFIKESSINDLN